MIGTSLIVATGAALGALTWPYLSVSTKNTIEEWSVIGIKGLILGAAAFVGFILIKLVFEKSSWTWWKFLGAVVGTEAVILGGSLALGVLYEELPMPHKHFDGEGFSIFTAVLSNWIFIPIVISKGVLMYTQSRESARKWSMFAMGVTQLILLPILVFAD